MNDQRSAVHDMDTPNSHTETNHGIDKSFLTAADDDIPTQSLVEIVSSVLEEMIKINERKLRSQVAQQHGNANEINQNSAGSAIAEALNPAVTPEVTIFCSTVAPGITIQAYLERFRKFSNCSDACFLVALVYLDRIVKRGFFLTALNVHRVILTCVLLATKCWDDMYYNNSFYAQLGGVKLKEMNTLELSLTFMLGWELHVTEHIYTAYHTAARAQLEKLARLRSSRELTSQTDQQLMTSGDSDRWNNKAASTTMIPPHVVTPPLADSSSTDGSVASDGPTEMDQGGVCTPSPTRILTDEKANSMQEDEMQRAIKIEKNFGVGTPKQHEEKRLKKCVSPAGLTNSHPYSWSSGEVSEQRDAGIGKTIISEDYTKPVKRNRRNRGNSELRNDKFDINKTFGRNRRNRRQE